MTEIMYLENGAEARRKWEFAKSFEKRAYPKAAKCMRDDERLFAYYQFPASTWYHFAHDQRHRIDFRSYQASYGCDETPADRAICHRRRTSSDLETLAKVAAYKDDFDACCIEARSMRYFAHAITPP